MKKLVAALILLCSISASSYMTKCINSENDDNIKAKTTLLKTFTIDYWRIATAEVVKLGPALQKKGFVAGDFHFNNVGLYFDYTKNRTELALNDFDDAGFNFLLVDLMKYTTYVEKLDKDIDVGELIKNYRAGLQQPGEIKIPLELLEETQLKFNKSSMKYLNNRKEEIAKFDKTKITPEQQAKIDILLRLKIISQLTDVNYMTKVTDSGSSKDMERYEFLGRDRNGNLGSIEFKKLKCSATGAAKFQDLAANFEYIRTEYLKNFSAIIANQYIYQLQGEAFLVRQKNYNPLKKLEIEKQGTKELQRYANFFAAFLGSIHAKSADKAYAEQIAANEKLIEKTAKDISKKFKDTVKD